MNVNFDALTPDAVEYVTGITGIIFVALILAGTSGAASPHGATRTEP